MRKHLEKDMIILMPSPYNNQSSNLLSSIMERIGGENELSKICDKHRKRFPDSRSKEIIIKLRYTFRGIPLRII